MSFFDEMFRSGFGYLALLCPLGLVLVAALVGAFAYYRLTKATVKRQGVKQHQRPILWRTGFEEGQTKSFTPTYSMSSSLEDSQNEGYPQEQEPLLDEDTNPTGVNKGEYFDRVFSTTSPLSLIEITEIKQPLALLKVIHGELEKNQYEIYEDRFLIGRGRDVNLQIKDERVSRNHAVIRYYENKWFIQDWQSLNGIRVNGNKVKAIQLHSGDEIEIAEWSFRFVDVRRDE